MCYYVSVEKVPHNPSFAKSPKFCRWNLPSYPARVLSLHPQNGGSAIGIVIKRIKQFEIQRSGRNGYIVYNTNLPWEGHHTHINDYGLCLKIVFNVLENRRPTMKKKRFLESHKRLAECSKYKKLMDELIENRKYKQKYVDRRGVR